MSQHNLQADNGAPRDVRLKIVAALLALGSCQSGPTEPAETWSFMRWADTTSGLLKLRNAANDGWITLLDLAAGSRIADVSGLQTALDGKAAASHSHVISNVTGLQTALDNKLGTTAQAADSAKLANMLPATAATASTIAQRDASGNLAATLFNGTATSARYA